jgi:long-subunit acyl-CoA synthetase (AMP-forming)
MRNELSKWIFETDLSKHCYSEDFNHPLSYQGLYEITQKLSDFIQGLTNTNCRVGLYSQEDSVYALYALALIENSIYVPINPKLNETQLIETLELFQIDVLFTDYKQTFENKKLVKFARWTFNSNHEFSGKKIKAKQVSDFCIITTTTGTTDQAKQVPLYYESWVYSIKKYNQFFDFDSDVKQYVYVHLQRVASLYIIFRTWVAHGEVIYHKEKNMSLMIESLKSEKVTHINGPPALFNCLIQALKVNNTKIEHNYKLQVHTSGASLNLALLEDMRYWLNADVYNNYGLTEVYYIASTYKCKALNYSHNGQMIIDDYKIVDKELWVKGPQVFKGYVISEQEFKNGWFRTGDIVEFDKNGYCKVVGRIKELINRGGEKISPYMIESLIQKIFPEIKQCVVFPIPNDYGSDDIGCAIVSKVTFNIREIRNHLLNHVEAYKCPTQLFQLTEIPVINNKISRNYFYEKHLKGKG